MKRVYFYLALLLVLSLAIPVYADKAETGNGAPSGAHYNLNIIGVSKDKTAAMDDNNGHRIFVNLVGNTKIMLGMGEFEVLDADGTDGTAAFQLPNPDPDNTGVTTYSVYARTLGKPSGSASMVTCATDVETGDEVCSVKMYILTMREKGKGGNKFTNVSKYLLYIYADLDGDTVLERYPLFDDALREYFWDYNNNGLKLAQFRFYYEESTTVSEPGDIE